MEKNKHLKQLYLQIVSSTDFNTFIELLNYMIDDLADVRKDIGSDDSVKVRKAIITYLQGNIDRIKRIRNNEIDKHKTVDQRADEY